MRLIIERTEYGLYAYRETEKQHRGIEGKSRGGIDGGRKVPITVLDYERYLEVALSVGDYIVVRL